MITAANHRRWISGSTSEDRGRYRVRHRRAENFRPEMSRPSRSGGSAGRKRPIEGGVPPRAHLAYRGPRPSQGLARPWERPASPAPAPRLRSSGSGQRIRGRPRPRDPRNPAACIGRVQVCTRLANQRTDETTSLASGHYSANPAARIARNQNAWLGCPRRQGSGGGGRRRLVLARQRRPPARTAGLPRIPGPPPPITPPQFLEN
jgi:hypothetical protein